MNQPIPQKSMPWRERLTQIKECVADAVRDTGFALNMIEQENGGPDAQGWDSARDALQDAADTLQQAALTCLFASAELSETKKPQ